MYSAIVLCAGKGKRSGLDYNKMFYEFDGKTVYEMTMEIFLNDPLCQQVVVVCQKQEQAQFEKIIKDERIEYVEGGKERQDSVYNGLKKVTQEDVLIHDGARPFVTRKNIHDLLDCLKKHKACLLMVPAIDTVKKVVDGKVVETLKREQLMQAQTPQAFKKDIIIEAYQKGIDSHYQATDDAQMVEMFANEEIYAVMGDYSNKKITTQNDLIKE